MAEDYYHGVRVLEVNDGTRNIRTISTAVLGFVAVADDADPDIFPENKPILTTDIASLIGKAGDKGTLAPTLEAIDKQASPVAVIVRVPEGQTEAETTSNVIGTTAENNQRTGLQALLVAQSQAGVKPRILGAPGLDTQAVTTALASVAQSLRAMAYAKCHGDSISDMIAYRNQHSARELMLIGPDFTGWDIRTSKIEEQAAIAYALGLRAKIDNVQGWNKTLSNVAVNGPLGISKPISWDLQSSDTDAWLLNSKDISTLINFEGYRFWGNRTCSSDPQFAFECYTRTAQILADTMAESQFYMVDGVMLPATVRDMVESMNAKLRSLTTQGYLLGGECWFDEKKNPKENLKAGQLKLSLKYGPTPPMEDIQIEQSFSDDYFMQFSQSVTY